MSGKSRGKSKIAAGFVIFINILTMLVCMFVFALSLWVIASPSTLLNTVRSFDNTTIKLLITEESLSLQLGVTGALLAGFFFCISFMGLYGAVTSSQFLLFMYATLLVLLLLLECSVTFYYTSNLEERGLQQDTQLNHVIRSVLQCCEQNYSAAVELIPPWSCCSVATSPTNCTIEKIFTMDCETAIPAWLGRYLTPFYVSLATLHIIYGVLLSPTTPSVSPAHLTIAAPFWRNSEETLDRHSYFTKHQTN